jgi:acetyltransferase
METAERLERVMNAALPNGTLELPEALSLVSAAGIPVAPFVVAGDPHEAAEAARSLGFPVALKAVGEGLSHKTEQGGVILNLANEDAVEKTASQMFKMLPVKRLVVMNMISGGQEVIVGAKQDHSFGPLVLFGLGGVTAEVLKDISLRLAPVDDAEAGGMLDSLRGAALLKGFRGRPKANRAAMLQVIMQVGNLAVRLPRLQELDLNPVLVGPGGALAVDARARVKPVHGN